MALSLLLQLCLATSALGGVIKLSTEKRPPAGNDLVHRDVLKRRAAELHARDPLLESLYNNRQQGGYFINISIGTPPQPLSVLLDTGSSDLWVMSTETDICKSRTLQQEVGRACYGGLFDPSESSSYEVLEEGGFSILYVDDSEATGDYVTEDVTFSEGATVSGLQIGISLSNTVGVGIMGVGYSTNVATTKKYPNVIDEMQSQGLIETRAYSLYLDSRTSTHGSILFGGIDTAKFIGELYTLPLQPRRSGEIDSFAVALTGLSIGTPGSLQPMTTQEFGIPVLLDSGTTLTYLPDQLVANLVDILGGYDDIAKTGSIWVDCALIEDNPDHILAYKFGGPNGPTINVPLREIIFDVPESAQQYFNLPWETTCYLGIQPSGDDPFYLLGDSFLRSAYVVYDLDNNQLAIANTNFHSDDEEIIEITSGPLPEATGVVQSTTVIAEGTGAPGVIGDRTSGVVRTVTPTGTSGVGGGITRQSVTPTSDADADAEETGGDGENAAMGSFDRAANGVWMLTSIWGVAALLGAGLLLG